MTQDVEWQQTPSRNGLVSIFCYMWGCVGMCWSVGLSLCDLSHCLCYCVSAFLSVRKWSCLTKIKSVRPSSAPHHRHIVGLWSLCWSMKDVQCIQWWYYYPCYKLLICVLGLLFQGSSASKSTTSLLTSNSRWTNKRTNERGDKKLISNFSSFSHYICVYRPTRHTRSPRSW